MGTDLDVSRMYALNGMGGIVSRVGGPGNRNAQTILDVHREWIIFYNIYDKAGLLTTYNHGQWRVARTN